MMDDFRNGCPMRHENGNCTVIGGFCTAVNDPICEGLHHAYDSGYRAAIGRMIDMENQPASKILELMAAELAEMLDGLPRRNPMVSVIEQRIEAINTANKALSDDHKDRPHGEWIQVIVHEFFEDGSVEKIKECCSVCNEPNGRRLSNFCPNCGAIMGGADSHE